MRDTSVRAASISSSVMRDGASWLRRPSTKRSARARNVAPFRVESPLARTTCGSAASSSAGEGRCPPKRCSKRDRIVRVALTESCWPATWKMSVPKASSPGSSSIHARMEVRMRVDHAREDRIGVPEEVARRRIRDCRCRHSFSSRSVSTISTTCCTVSRRAQSRWSSHASATQLTGRPPACSTRWMPARWASSEVPPIASTTG
jgi:hypothetical protein